jgi:hypothetical protein
MKQLNEAKSPELPQSSNFSLHLLLSSYLPIGGITLTSTSNQHLKNVNLLTNTFAKQRKRAKPGCKQKINLLILFDFQNRIFSENSPKSKLAKVLEMPGVIFIAQVVSQMAVLGRINHTVNPI